MARNPRLFLPHMPLHIVQRGHNRNAVFVQQADYAFYLKNLKQVKSDLHIQVFGYCLMTNHVHLLLAPNDDVSNVSGLMKILAARQTRYVNKLEKRSGTLWEGRFKASLIDSDSYLLACYRYVDMNPVRARIVNTAFEYRWSSFADHVGLAPAGWLDDAPSFLALGRTVSGLHAAYLEFVEQLIPEPQLRLIRSAIQRNQITGSENFQAQIAARTGRRVSTRAQGRPAKTSK
jgi:REP-associated tyrosine transposase